MKKDETLDTLIKNTDIDYVNKLLDKSQDLKDFQISKSTLANISNWALNGASDKEIRKNLDLDKHQWAILCTVCPTLLMIMGHSRAMADLVVAGSLFQTAIGGKKIRKKVPLKVKIYDERGKVTGEKYELVEYDEELPPNPYLLKFLAEHKLSEQFGDKQENKNDEMKKFVENMSEKDKALIMSAMQHEVLDGED